MAVEEEHHPGTGEGTSYTPGDMDEKGTLILFFLSDHPWSLPQDKSPHVSLSN